MSDLPTSPESSLIERLKKITGLTPPPPEPEPASPAAPPAYDAPPPVDKLIAGMRDGFTLVVACGIAATVLGVALAIRACQSAKPLCLAAGRKSREWGTKTADLSRKSLHALREKTARLRASRQPDSAPGETPLPPVNTDAGTQLAAKENVSLLKTDTAPALEMQEITPAPEPPSPPRPLIIPAGRDETVRPVKPIARPTGRTAPVETADFAPPVSPPAAASAAPDTPATATATATASRLPLLLRRLRFPAAALLLSTGALAAIPASRYYFTDWMGWSNARVVAGEDGWIFLRSEIEPPAKTLPLKDTAAGLRSKGAALIVLSLPSRISVYPEKTGAARAGKITRDPAVAAALAELSASGVSVVDLAGPLTAQKSGDAKDGPLFNPQDTHWSPRGMIFCASAAAAHIQQQPAFTALPMNPSLAILEEVNPPAASGPLVAEWKSARARARYAPHSQPLIRLLTPDKKEPLPDDPQSGLVLLGGPALAAYDTTGVSLPGNVPPAAGFARHLAYQLNTTVHTHTAATAMAAATAWIKAESAEARPPRKLIVWLLEDADFRAVP